MDISQDMEISLPCALNPQKEKFLIGEKKSFRFLFVCFSSGFMDKKRSETLLSSVTLSSCREEARCS